MFVLDFMKNPPTDSKVFRGRRHRYDNTRLSSLKDKEFVHAYFKWIPRRARKNVLKSRWSCCAITTNNNRNSKFLIPEVFVPRFCRESVCPGSDFSWCSSEYPGRFTFALDDDYSISCDAI